MIEEDLTPNSVLSNHSDHSSIVSNDIPTTIDSQKLPSKQTHHLANLENIPPQSSIITEDKSNK
jgi:hypothetical protein